NLDTGGATNWRIWNQANSFLVRDTTNSVSKILINPGATGVISLTGPTGLNGVTYTWPRGDGSASGKVLKTNGAGQLSWSTDQNSGTTYSAGQGLGLASGLFTLNSALSGSLVRFTTISGSTVFGKNALN